MSKNDLTTLYARTAFIFQCDTHRLYTINLDNRTYWSCEIDDRGARTTPPPRPPGFVELPPLPPLETSGVITVNIEDIDTGERKQMFGYTARRIVTRRTSTPGPGVRSYSHVEETDGWYIDLINPPPGCPPRRGRTMAMVVGGVGGSPKLEIHHTGVNENGFPVRTAQRELSLAGRPAEDTSPRIVREVIELSAAPLDPALFEPPRGFKMIPEPTGNLGGPVYATRMQQLWTWAKQYLY